jgi:hypothetical protein
MEFADNNANEPSHTMTYTERETLKDFARRGRNNDQIVILICHWMRNHDVDFSTYAANWAAANSSEDVSAIQKQWPLTGPRMIADDCSNWGSFGTSS